MRFSRVLVLLAAMLFVCVPLFTACARPLSSAPIAATPQPDIPPENTGEEAPGTLGMLARTMTKALGFTVSAGADASEPALGGGAARLAVEALGLAAERTLQNMGTTDENTDWLSIALEYNVAPYSLFTDEPMTLEQMEQFANAVAERASQGLGVQARQWNGNEIELDGDMRTLCAIATIAYNPLAKNRAAFHYSEGDIQKLSYWTLAAFGTVITQDNISPEMKGRLSFVIINDQTDPSKGTTTADEEEFRACVRELWGIQVPQTVDGLLFSGGRVYLGRPSGDEIRQFSYPYNAEVMGELVRVTADVLNVSVPAQHAGKVWVTLRKNAQAKLGYQIAYIEKSSDMPPLFVDASSPTTSAESSLKLIDSSRATVWQMSKSATSDEAYITLAFDEPTSFSGLAFLNGNHSSSQTALDKGGWAGIAGVRLDGGETDIMRFDLSGNTEPLRVGLEVVIPFERQFTATTVTIVFYREGLRDPVMISGVRAL